MPIPKTAGTTLQDFILGHYFPFGRAYRFTGAVEQVEQFRCLPQEERDGYDVIAGHVHFGVHELLSQPATYLTMLREPVEHFIKAARVHATLTHLARPPHHALYPRFQ